MKSIQLFFANLTFGKKILLTLTPVITLLLSMKLAILGLFLLILLDLLAGIRKNLYKNKVPFNPLKKLFWLSIKSYLLRQTWKKTTEYVLGILAITVLESLILGGTPIELIGKVFTISELSVIIPSAIEVWSIFENLEKVSGRNPLKRLKDFLPTFLKKILINEKES